MSDVNHCNVLLTTVRLFTVYLHKADDTPISSHRLVHKLLVILLAALKIDQIDMLICEINAVDKLISDQEHVRKKTTLDLNPQKLWNLRNFVR